MPMYAQRCVRNDPNSVQAIRGVYHFTHPGGAIEVHLRPNGQLFAPAFSAKASWMCRTSSDSTRQLLIEWGEHGQYVLNLEAVAPTHSFSGSLFEHPESWRKVQLRTESARARARVE